MIITGVESISDLPHREKSFIAWMLVMLIELASVITIFLMTDAEDFYTLPVVLVFIVVCFAFSIRIRPYILTRHR